MPAVVACPTCHEPIPITVIVDPPADGRVGVTYDLSNVFDHAADRHEVHRDHAQRQGRPHLARQSFNGHPLIRRCPH